jgi:hypothetical protein
MPPCYRTCSELRELFLGHDKSVLNSYETIQVINKQLNLLSIFYRWGLFDKIRHTGYFPISPYL